LHPGTQRHVDLYEPGTRRDGMNRTHTQALRGFDVVQLIVNEQYVVRGQIVPEQLPKCLFFRFYVPGGIRDQYSVEYAV
jgi:hypothetical protein